MKIISIACLALLAGGLSASAQGLEKKIQVVVENPWNAEKVDEPVVIDLGSLGTGFTVKSAVVRDGSVEIPSQLDDMNCDTRADELAFVINLPASSKKTLDITLSSLKSDKQYPARVYAEMLFRTSKKNKYAKGYAIYADGASDTGLPSKVSWWRIVFISTRSRQPTCTGSSTRGWSWRRVSSTLPTSS
jgi:hypothetical protein